MQKKLLLLGSGPGTVDMICYAKEIGVYTVVTDWLDVDHSEAKRLADEYWMISYSDIEILKEKCLAENISAVATASSEFATDIMIQLCTYLNLPCYAEKDSFYYEKNKAAFKGICKEVGVPVPKDYTLPAWETATEDELNQIEYPVVVKPVDQCGSKGVAYCYNSQELIRACRAVREISDNPEIIIEKKIEGKEFAAYYALADGEASLLFLHSELAADKNSAGACFAASNVTDCVGDFVATVNDKIIKALKKCGCRENAAWVQLKQDNKGDFYVFELGYRLGADLAPFEYSRIGELNLAKWAVECAFGIKHEKKQLPIGLKAPMNKYLFSYMLCCGKSGIVTEIQGIQELRQYKNVHIVLDICVGDEFQAGGKELGCIGFYAYSLEELHNLILEINHVIHIINQNNEDMILPYVPLQRFLEEEYNIIH